MDGILRKKLVVLLLSGAGTGGQGAGLKPLPKFGIL